MGQTKVFKCPKCGRLLTLKLQLPENVERWPFLIKIPHVSEDGSNCVIELGIDPNYQIRELGRSDMGC